MIARPNNPAPGPNPQAPPLMMWSAFLMAVAKLINRLDEEEDGLGIYGAGIGGQFVAMAVALGATDKKCTQLDKPEEGCLILADFVTPTGEPLRAWMAAGFKVDAAFRAADAPVDIASSAVSIQGSVLPPWIVEFKPPEQVIAQPGDPNFRVPIPLKRNR